MIWNFPSGHHKNNTCFCAGLQKPGVHLSTKCSETGKSATPGKKLNKESSWIFSGNLSICKEIEVKFFFKKKDNLQGWIFVPVPMFQLISGYAAAFGFSSAGFATGFFIHSSESPIKANDFMNEILTSAGTDEVLVFCGTISRILLFWTCP